MSRNKSIETRRKKSAASRRLISNHLQKKTEMGHTYGTDGRKDRRLWTYWQILTLGSRAPVHRLSSLFFSITLHYTLFIV